MQHAVRKLERQASGGGELPAEQSVLCHERIPLQDRLQSLTSEWGISEVGEEFAVSFFTYGVIGSLIRWLDDGMPEDIDQVINDIHNLIHPKEKETLLPSYGGVDDDKKTM